MQAQKYKSISDVTMTGVRRSLALLVVICGMLTTCTAVYQPTWESLDTRKNPAWYERARFGIKIHWGNLMAMHLTVMSNHIVTIRHTHKALSRAWAGVRGSYRLCFTHPFGVNSHVRDGMVGAKT